MKTSDFECFLQGHGVKPTANRLIVVRTLAASPWPMSLAELEQRILTLDKSSVFRALTLFREHHVVHAIEDGVKESNESYRTTDLQLIAQ